MSHAEGVDHRRAGDADLEVTLEDLLELVRVIAYEDEKGHNTLIIVMLRPKRILTHGISQGKWCALSLGLRVHPR